MFGIGFWEFIVISVIALLVVGPEQLPTLARNIGKLASMLRRLILDARQELERSIYLDEQKELDRRLSSMDDLLKIAPDQKDGFQPLSPPSQPARTESSTSAPEAKDAGKS